MILWTHVDRGRVAEHHREGEQHPRVLCTYVYEWFFGLMSSSVFHVLMVYKSSHKYMILWGTYVDRGRVAEHDGEGEQHPGQVGRGEGEEVEERQAHVLVATAPHVHLWSHAAEGQWVEACADER
jgi:hypothetical protein